MSQTGVRNTALQQYARLHTRKQDKKQFYFRFSAEQNIV
jgi:hypothetical protein